MCRLAVSVVLFCITAVALPTISGACECIPGNTPPARRGGEVEDQPTVHFEWLSKVTKMSNDYCYERVVENKNATRPLDYNWPLAGMKNVALGARVVNRRCKYSGPPGNKPESGPITYGRNNPPETTEVWKAPGELAIMGVSPTSGLRPEETYLDLASTISGRTVSNAAILRSFVTNISSSGSRRFRYTYVLENREIDSRIVLSWVPIILQAAQQDPRLKSLLRRVSGGDAIEVSGAVPIIIEHELPPALGAFPAIFFDPTTGTPLASGVAEAYVPVK